MSSASVLSPRRLAEITKPPEASISRTGRNEAINSSVKLASTNKPVVVVAKKKKKEDPVDGTVFDSTSFGTGERSDRGAGHEMSSSPRSHPLMVSYEKRAYEASRMEVFDGIRNEVPKLDLLDEGSVTQNALYARKTGTAVSRPSDLDDVDSMASDEGITPTEGNPTPTKAIADLTPTKANPANVSQQSISPRKKEPTNTQSSSFMSPKRWQPTSPRTQVPPVGHYRPKHESTQNATTHGYICSPQKMTPREKPERERSVLPSVQTARARLEQEENGPIAPQSPSMDLDDLTTKTTKLAPPEPSKNSTSAFKSKIQQCVGTKIYSAAPDVMYWPRNDEATGFSVPSKGQVRFEKQTPRKPIVVPLDVPEAYYNLSNATKNDQCGVNMEKQTPRPPPRVAPSTDAPFYEVSRADKVTKAAGKVADFTKTSPRKEVVHSVANVSVDQVENYKDSGLTTKRVPLLNMDRLKGRTAQEIPHLNDLVYQSSAELTSPRERGAIIRADNTGHQPLFQPSITDNCSYDPQITPTRPKTIRTVDFAKDLKRKPQTTQLHDLSYDVKEVTTTNRTRGDPMMSSHVDRDKREKILSPRRIHTEASSAQINLDKVRPTKTGASIDFSKQITKETQFAGRGMPSDRFQRNNPTAPPPGSYDWM